MDEEIMRIRMPAARRFKAGESPEPICISLGKSRFWLYKWVKRFDGGNPSWSEDHLRRPQETPNRTASEIEEIAKMVRLNFYNQDLCCGAQALPSIRTINRILARNDMAHRRTGRMSPKRPLILLFRRFCRIRLFRLILSAPAIYKGLIIIRRCRKVMFSVVMLLHNWHVEPPKKVLYTSNTTYVTLRQ